MRVGTALAFVGMLIFGVGAVSASACTVATTLTEKALPATGVAPQTVTFTYDESNDGAVAISNVTVVGSLAGPAVYQSGDTNHNHVLDPGETWVFTAAKSFEQAGTYTDVTTANGTDSKGQAAPAEHASATVELKALPVPPAPVVAHHPHRHPVAHLGPGAAIGHLYLPGDQRRHRPDQERRHERQPDRISGVPNG